MARHRLIALFALVVLVFFALAQGCGGAVGVPPTDLDAGDGGPQDGNGPVTLDGGDAVTAEGGASEAATNADTGGPDSAVRSFTIGGTVTGLSSGLDGGAAGSVTLQNNTGDVVAVAANGAFSFKKPIDAGGAYAVTVLVQPTNPSQTCTITGGAGTVSKDVTGVAVVCTTNTYGIGGTLTGLASGDAGANAVVLQDNNGDDLTVSANGAFSFPTKIASGAGFHVTVKSHPKNPGQLCVVTGATGTVVAGTVTSVAVNCTGSAYTVGGTITGLAGTVVLRNNNGDDLAVTSLGQFAFATPLVSGTGYAVTVLTQPGSPSQTCVVASGSGTVAAANVTGVVVTCTTDTYSIGGNLSGLANGTVVLRNNGGDSLTVTDGAFTFPTRLVGGASYSVTVLSQPAGITCTVTSGTGTVAAADVTNVAVACAVTTYFIGGTVTGLSGTLVLRNNGGDNLTLTPGTLLPGNGFRFATKLTDGSTYAVSVLTNPSSPSQTCTVTTGTGTVAGADVTSVQVTCVNTYSVGGSVSNLYGTGLTLTLNGDPTNTVTLSAPTAAFTFPKLIPSGATYAVTVTGQPTTYFQSCVPSGSSGTIGAANVTNAVISCGFVTRILITSNVFKVSGVTQPLPAPIPDGTSNDCNADLPSAALIGDIVITNNHFTVNTTLVTLSTLDHTWAGDLRAQLQLNPSSIIATTPLFDRVGRNPVAPTTCGSMADFTGDYTFSDAASTTPWSSTSPGTYHPSGANGNLTFLNATRPNGFRAELTGGTWRLSITDSGLGDQGAITAWTLDLRP